MKSTKRNQGNVTVITLEGNLMGGPDASELNNQIHALVQEGKTRIALDFGAVDFINSSGLGILIGSASLVSKAGGRLLLANASKKVHNLITITKLTSILETRPTLPDAIASLRE